MVSSKGWVMPGSPAPPNSSAYSDQPNAASTPIEMSVSMVAAPWRRLVQAAVWNGQAPHTATGAASASEIHCQYVNWKAGTIASAMTGTVSSALTINRSRSARVESDSATATATASTSSADGAGSVAV